MKFLAVDDEALALRKMERTLRRLYPGAEVICADNYQEALLYKNEAFDVALLDIEMPGMDGLTLAQELQKYNPKLNVILVTAYDSYARKAFQIHVSNYITKPYEDEDILHEMENLRFPLEDKKIHVRCFGYFEIFDDGQPIIFERRSSKEILAYLVHLRGATATRADIGTILWEDADEIEKKKGYFRSLITSLRNTLKKHNQEDILICHRDSYAINTQKLDCDYYRFLKGDTDSDVQFRGEYMSQYSWGESTIGMLMDWK